jgi:hypothetical protein
VQSRTQNTLRRVAHERVLITGSADGIALAGLVVGPVGWSGDELGEMLQQGRLPADAVLGMQAPVGQLANGSVEPGPVASIATVRDR